MAFDNLAPDDDTPGLWDQDTGSPTVSHFGNAIQVWTKAQEKQRSVNAAALAFNVRPELVRQAVEAHAWMFLDGDMICHDGE